MSQTAAQKTPKTISKTSSLAKRSGLVSFYTLISRILGLLRDRTLSRLLGADATSDAFYIAFRIPSLLRKLLAEGSLTISFIPIFSQYLKKDNEEDSQEAKKLANVIFTILFFVLILVCIAGISGASWIVYFIASKFRDNAELLHFTTYLTQITFAYIAFVSFAALVMGILNARFRFGAPAAAPIFLNLSIILCTLFLKDYFGHAAIAAAWGVFLGGFLQLAIQIPWLLKEGFGFKFNFNFKHPGLSKVGRLFIPSLLGSAVYQINVFISTFLANRLPDGYFTYLWNADRLVALPIGIFAVALATVTLPSFSKLSSENDLSALQRELNKSLKLISFINIPAAFGLAAMTLLAVSLLYQVGKFDAVASQLTAEAVLYFCLGLPFIACNRILASYFYSVKDARTPVIAAIFSLIANVVCGYLLMESMMHRGLALAVSIASLVNFVILFVVLLWRLPNYPIRDLSLTVLKIFTASILMFLLIYALLQFFINPTLMNLYQRLGLVILTIGLGLISYVLFCLLFRIDEFWMLKAKIFKAKNRK